MSDKADDMTKDICSYLNTDKLEHVRKMLSLKYQKKLN